MLDAMDGMPIRVTTEGSVSYIIVEAMQAKQVLALLDRNGIRYQAKTVPSDVVADVPTIIDLEAGTDVQRVQRVLDSAA